MNLYALWVKVRSFPGTTSFKVSRPYFFLDLTSFSSPPDHCPPVTMASTVAAPGHARHVSPYGLCPGSSFTCSGLLTDNHRVYPFIFFPSLSESLLSKTYPKDGMKIYNLSLPFSSQHPPPSCSIFFSIAVTNFWSYLYYNCLLSPVSAHNIKASSE